MPSGKHLRMYPILFQTSAFTLYTQTIFMAIAFIAGLWLAAHEAKRFELPHDTVVNVAMSAFLGAILGARLFFMFVFQESTRPVLKELCSLGALDGGFSFHGGLLGGAFCAACAAYVLKAPLLRLADVFAPGLALAMFFMRLGCLFNGCDYGVATTAPWGIWLHGTVRHPIQLYEGLASLLIILPVLIVCNRKVLRAGHSFLCYLFLSSLLRFLVDFYRDDASRNSAALLATQWLAGALFLTSGMIIFLTFFTRRHPCKYGDPQ